MLSVFINLFVKCSSHHFKQVKKTQNQILCSNLVLLFNTTTNYVFKYYIANNVLDGKCRLFIALVPFNTFITFSNK